MTTIKVLWKILNIIISSISEFNDSIKCVVRSSPNYPSNLGIFEGKLNGTGGQFGLCITNSFFNLVRYKRFNVTTNDNVVWENAFQLLGAWPNNWFALTNELPQVPSTKWKRWDDLITKDVSIAWHEFHSSHEISIYYTSIPIN